MARSRPGSARTPRGCRDERAPRRDPGAVPDRLQESEGGTRPKRHRRLHRPRGIARRPRRDVPRRLHRRGDAHLDPGEPRWRPPGHAASSEGKLELYGGMRGESLLDPIEDFAKVKAALEKVPNVKQVVPMGIDQAMVATGNVFDTALERLRADARQLEAGERDPRLVREWGSHKAHVRRMVGLLRGEIQQALAIVDPDSKEAKDRAQDFAALQLASTEAFWEGV